jgi:hypothetical protein
VRVGGYLDAIGEASSEIVHEVVGRVAVPVSNEPAGNELGIGAEHHNSEQMRSASK